MQTKVVAGVTTPTPAFADEDPYRVNAKEIVKRLPCRLKSFAAALSCHYFCYGVSDCDPGLFNIFFR